jgi:hypothetical protein
MDHRRLAPVKQRPRLLDLRTLHGETVLRQQVLPAVRIGGRPVTGPYPLAEQQGWNKWLVQAALTAEQADTPAASLDSV